MVVWPHDVGEEKLNNEANSLSSLGTNEVLIYQCFILETICPEARFVKSEPESKSTS
jgi:hypothetical protein